MKKIEIDTNNGANLQALFSSIKLYKSMDIQKFIIETDFAFIVSWMTKNIFPTWYLWDFWKPLQLELQGPNFLITHIYKEGNQIADFLVKVGERDRMQIFTK